MDLGVLFDLQILLVDFLSQSVLPFHVGIQEFLLCLINLSLQSCLLSLAFGFQLLVALDQVVMLNLELIQIRLHFSFVPVEVHKLFFEFGDLSLEIEYVFFQYFLL